MNGGAAANYGWGLPVAASTFAKDVDRGIWLLHGSMIAIFLVWSAVFVYFLVAYRARPGHSARPPSLSRWWLALPLILIFSDEIYMITGYAMPAWRRIVETMPAEAEANVVEVIPEQYAWNFHYPGKDGRFGRRGAAFVDSANVLGLDPEDPDGKDDVVTLNELRVPLGRPTLAYLSAKDVIHSFFIPEFRVKKDCVPGMREPVWFEPSRAGRFELACAQLCGIGHTHMRADVIAQAAEEFEAWLAEQAGSARL